MSSWRTRLHCPQLWPREKEVCLRENCFRENRLRESPPSSCRGRLCSTKRTCETFAVKAWKDSSVEAQRSLYSTSTRCEQMPTSSASSSNVEISRLIEERYVSPTWRHVLVGEGLVVILRCTDVMFWVRHPSTPAWRKTQPTSKPQIQVLSTYRLGQEEVCQPRPDRLLQPAEMLWKMTTKSRTQVLPIDRIGQQVIGSFNFWISIRASQIKTRDLFPKS